MNPVVLYLASGETLYVGGGILLLTALFSHWAQSRWGIRVRNFLGIIGAILLALSCAPLPWILYGGLAAGFIGWFVAWNWGEKKWLRTGTSAAVAIMIATAVTMELPYRNGRILSYDRRHAHLTVIGDSISAGIGGEPWPSIYANESRVQIKNLSRAGLVTGEAMTMANQVETKDTLVLIELGGNDLLMDVSAADFERDLNQLLQTLASPMRQVVMMELPLLPHKLQFGRIQRRLAEKYNVRLIPKRHFIQVLAGADATSDGLHLSKTGAAKMSKLVDQFVGKTLRRH